MTEQAKILGRIREALRLSAPLPGEHVHPGEDHAPRRVTGSSDPRAWLPAVGATFEERLATFTAQSTELRTDFHLLDSAEAMTSRLQEIAKTEGWSRVASHRAALTTPSVSALGLPTLITDIPYTPQELEQCAAGITECDALIAQTGSVLITCRSAGGRGLSVLPPHHVVLVRREQLLPDLPAAFALLKSKYSENYPSFMSVITGPSRTGDIERILVLGAHGPKKLTILCY